MAQKKRKEPEVKEEYTFVPPDFDEREFLEKDITVTKTVLVSALLATVFGVLAFFTTDISYVIGLLLIIVGAASLRYMFKTLPIDVSKVENKTWLGNGAMFFFLALGIWILLLNPPFGDYVDPQISDVQVWSGGLEISRSTVPVGESVVINVTVVDNHHISKVTMTFTDPTGSTYEMTKGQDGRYGFEITFDAPNTTYNYVITAVDGAGNQQTLNGWVKTTL